MSQSRPQLRTNIKMPGVKRTGVGETRQQRPSRHPGRCSRRLYSTHYRARSQGGVIISPLLGYRTSQVEGTGHLKDEDVKEFARQLWSEGIDAREWGESIGSGRGVLLGIMLTGLGFFPLWELNEPHNQQLVAARDFTSIKARRGREWEPVPPKLWKTERRQL